MKKILALLISVLCLYSCVVENDSSTASLVEETATVGDDILKALQMMGFNTESVIDFGEAVIVEGDILISKDYRLNYFLSTTKQSHFGQLVDDYCINNISVYITPGVSEVWATAIRIAIDAWSSIPNCKIRLYEVNEPGADITCQMFALPDSALAMAFFPGQSIPSTEVPPVKIYIGPGTHVYINNNFLNYDRPGNAAWAMVHELGHTLGFVHTDLNDYNGTIIPGTSTDDPNSVMNSYNTGVNWSWFSEGDIVGAQYLYPANGVFIRGFSSVPLDPTIYYEYYLVDNRAQTPPKYLIKYTWTVMYKTITGVSINLPVIDMGDNIKVAFPGAGNYFITLSIKKTSLTGQITTETVTKSVIVSGSGI